MTDDEIAAIKARYELAREAASDSFSLSLLEDAIEDIPTLLDEVERLRAECFALAANQCHAGYSDDKGNHLCRVVDAERAEVERLSDLIYESIPKWQARDLLRERDEARDEVKRLRAALKTRKEEA